MELRAVIWLVAFLGWALLGATGFWLIERSYRRCLESAFKTANDGWRESIAGWQESLEREQQAIDGWRSALARGGAEEAS